MFRIQQGMTLKSRRLGYMSVVVGATASNYLIETDGHVAELHAIEIYEYFEPVE